MRDGEPDLGLQLSGVQEVGGVGRARSPRPGPAPRAPGHCGRGRDAPTQLQDRTRDADVHTGVQGCPRVTQRHQGLLQLTSERREHSGRSQRNYTQGVPQSCGGLALAPCTLRVPQGAPQVPRRGRVSHQAVRGGDCGYDGDGGGECEQRAAAQVPAAPAAAGRGEQGVEGKPVLYSVRTVSRPVPGL